MAFSRHLASCWGSRPRAVLDFGFCICLVQLMPFPSARGSWFRPDPAGCPGVQALNESTLLAEGAWDSFGVLGGMGPWRSCKLPPGPGARWHRWLYHSEAGRVSLPQWVMLSEENTCGGPQLPGPCHAQVLEMCSVHPMCHLQCAVLCDHHFQKEAALSQ